MNWQKAVKTISMNFAVWLRIPRKNWFLKKKKMKSVSEQKQSTPKIAPSFGPNEKPELLKMMLFTLIFCMQWYYNVLFIEKKNIGKAGLKVILNCVQLRWPAKQIIAWPRLISDQSKCWNIAIKFYYKTLIYYWHSESRKMRSSDGISFAFSKFIPAST